LQKDPGAKRWQDNSKKRVRQGLYFYSHATKKQESGMMKTELISSFAILLGSSF
jgi:hypothetical protein